MSKSNHPRARKKKKAVGWAVRLKSGDLELPTLVTKKEAEESIVQSRGMYAGCGNNTPNAAYEGARAVRVEVKEISG